jgi:hypothetical protein
VAGYPVTGAPYKEKGEEVIGIPEKGVTHPIRPLLKAEDWEFVVHSHEAKRAGHHFDLRLGDPEKGHAHSWALRGWPAAGEKKLAVIQSTHSMPYMNWEGTIEKGYGAGKVEIADRRKARIIKSSPDRITFSPGPDELYSLIRTKSRDGKAWLLVNHSSATPRTKV